MKSERITIVLDPRQLETIAQAAEANDESLSQFARRAALERARQVEKAS